MLDIGAVPFPTGTISNWVGGYYPVCFGYDAKGKVCAVYVRFIHIEDGYREQE